MGSEPLPVFLGLLLAGELGFFFRRAAFEILPDAFFFLCFVIHSRSVEMFNVDKMSAASSVDQPTVDQRRLPSHVI